MPIYEYRCKHCAHDFEALVWSRSDEQSICCPKCESTEIRRLLSAFCTSGGGASESSKSSCSPKGGFG